MDFAHTLFVQIDIALTADGQTVLTKYITVDSDGIERSEEETSLTTTRSSYETGELLACIKALQGAHERGLTDKAGRVCVETNSKYVLDNIGRALFEWPRRRWLGKDQRPIDNAAPWKRLIREMSRNSKRIEFKPISVNKTFNVKAAPSPGGDSGDDFEDSVHAGPNTLISELSSRRPVCILADEIIDQIAAGEVVERPASVVKELVENSLDAGARHIEVNIERGGVGLIRVTDDGVGMDTQDAALALQRHATSKIVSMQDLESVTTLGFRGEAMPSIASVSRLRLLTRTASADHAVEIQADGAARSDARPAARVVGTTIEVRDLFFNVPARRKFVRSEKTEAGHIVRLVERLALARPDVSFQLRNGEQLIVDAHAGESPSEQAAARVRAIIGDEFFAQALPFEHSAGSFSVGGWLGFPTASRGSPDQQFWFINGRSVRDRLLSNAVRLGYRDVMFHGRYPAFVMYLTLDPTMVDVNAHPTKLEVRFRNSQQIHDFVFRSVAEALAHTQPRPALPEIYPATPAANGTSGGGANPQAPRYERTRDPWQVTAVLQQRALQPLALELGTPNLVSLFDAGRQPEPITVSNIEQSLGTPLVQIRGTYIVDSSNFCPIFQQLMSKSSFLRKFSP